MEDLIKRSTEFEVKRIKAEYIYSLSPPGSIPVKHRAIIERWESGISYLIISDDRGNKVKLSLPHVLRLLRVIYRELYWELVGVIRGDYDD